MKNNYVKVAFATTKSDGQTNPVLDTVANGPLTAQLVRWSRVAWSTPYLSRIFANSLKKFGSMTCPFDRQCVR